VRLHSTSFFLIEESVMHKVILALLVCVLPILGGCGSSQPKDQIIGKWQAVEGDAKKGDTILEFKKDGSVSMTAGEGTVTGKYTFTQDDIVDVAFEFMGRTEANKMKVEFKGDEMTTTDQDAKKAVNKWKRVK
jgi:uncharacterized protein (TIGR03066 family)